MIAGLACLSILPSASSSVPQDVDPQSLKGVLASHVEAIQRRDINALARTLTAAKDLTLILPDGRRTTTRVEYLKVHAALFATPDWSVSFEPVTIVETDALAIVATRSEFRSYPGMGDAKVNWVTLVFRLESDGWKLIFDQNTRADTATRHPLGAGSS